MPARRKGPAPRDGLIEAMARTPILGFRDDVAVRVRATNGGRPDRRSLGVALGRHDLGTNAARVRTLIEDIDDVLATRQSPRRNRRRRRPTQPAGKGGSAKR